MGNKLEELWQRHQDAQWPESLGSTEGELMMIDTVVVGCITYFVEEQGLDEQRIGILKDSLSELDEHLSDLSDEGVEYFSRLKELGSLVLQAST